jgi:hypothetical protein
MNGITRGQRRLFGQITLILKWWTFHAPTKMGTFYLSFTTFAFYGKITINRTSAVKVA